MVPPRGRMSWQSLGAEGHDIAFHDARPAVAEADDLVAVLALTLGGDGANDRVQPGAVASAGQDSHTHGSASAKKVCNDRTAPA